MTGSTAKKGRLSVDEKRKRLEEFFHEKNDFFQLKDLEKLVPKEKGIVAQTVKEILQSLVDDHLVICEKIGTSNYYWSFPKTALLSRSSKLQALRSDIERSDRSIVELSESIVKARVGREDTEERRELVAEWEELGRQLRTIDKELDAFKENDPVLHAIRINENAERRVAINMWTDNISTVQSYCASTFNIPREQVRESFEIPDDLEYA